MLKESSEGAENAGGDDPVAFGECCVGPREKRWLVLGCHVRSCEEAGQQEDSRVLLFSDGTQERLASDAERRRQALAWTATPLPDMGVRARARSVRLADSRVCCSPLVLVLAPPAWSALLSRTRMSNGSRQTSESHSRRT